LVLKSKVVGGDFLKELDDVADFELERGIGARARKVFSFRFRVCGFGGVLD